MASTTDPATRILPALEAGLPRMLDDIGQLVRTESPGEDLAAVADCARVVAGLGTRLTGASAELFELARRHYAELGLGTLRGVAVGGASDGNLTAGAGTSTLDGLGAVGGGAHADDEHVVVAELPRRAALV
ncbi:hypothetical protein ACFU6N_18800, partial [Streptomyces sp. NPDC057496]